LRGETERAKIVKDVLADKVCVVVYEIKGRI
jgi:hypothetical protein